MTEKEYFESSYNMAAQTTIDKISVFKYYDSDIAEIKLEVNGNESGYIELRSKKMAEQLHFMLGQLLEK